MNGDVNTDGVVNGLDINIVAGRWLQSGIQGDAIGDGIVNGLDINLIASNWLKTDSGGGAGSGAAVPEPSSLGQAAVGGLMLLARLIALRNAVPLPLAHQPPATTVSRPLIVLLSPGNFYSVRQVTFTSLRLGAADHERHEFRAFKEAGPHVVPLPLGNDQFHFPAQRR